MATYSGHFQDGDEDDFGFGEEEESPLDGARRQEPPLDELLLSLNPLEWQPGHPPPLEGGDAAGTAHHEEHELQLELEQLQGDHALPEPPDEATAPEELAATEEDSEALAPARGVDEGSSRPAPPAPTTTTDQNLQEPDVDKKAQTPLPPASPSASSCSRSPLMKKRARWRESTQQNVACAKALAKRVFISLNIDAYRERKEEDASVAPAAQVTQVVKRKIATTEELTKALEDRVSSVEDSIRQAGENLVQLQRVYRAKGATLSVCERRLELRERRPEQERVADQCQLALEAEKRMLEDCREDLGQLVERAMQSLLRLDAVKEELLRELQSKRQMLRIDRGFLSARCSMSANSRSSSRPESRHVLPPLEERRPRSRGSAFGSPKAESARGAVGEKPIPVVDARALLGKASSVEEEGLHLCNRGDKAIKRWHRECTAAGERTHAALQHKIMETNSLKKDLEAQKLEIDDAIKRTELALSKTRKRLELHDEPLRAIEVHLSAAGNRGSADEEEEAAVVDMESQLVILKRSAQGLENKCQANEELLQRLRASKEQMVEDLRCKTAAKSIDDQCMKVTPRRARDLDKGLIGGVRPGRA